MCSLFSDRIGLTRESLFSGEQNVVCSNHKSQELFRWGAHCPIMNEVEVTSHISMKSTLSQNAMSDSSTMRLMGSTLYIPDATYNTKTRAMCFGDNGPLIYLI